MEQVTGHEQPRLEFMHDDSYKFSPQTKEDWEKIIADATNGNHNKEEGAYTARVAPGGSYYLGKWIIDRSSIGDPNTLLFSPLPSGENEKMYVMAGLPQPRIDEIIEIEDDLEDKPPFRKKKWSS